MEELNKKNPFKAPEDYFGGFNDRLMDRLSERRSNIPKEDGFTVPENYFEVLPVKLLKKLEAGETKVIPFRSYKKYYFAAASIAAIALVVFGLNRNTSENMTFEDLADSDIESYFENNELDLSTYEIAEVIPVDELEISDILAESFDEENVLDYLNENTDDFDELNLEDNE